MQSRPDHPAFAALLGLLGTVLRAPSIGIFAWTPDRCDFWSGTPGLASLGPPRAGVALPPSVREAVNIPTLTRIDPRALGYSGAFGALLPIVECEDRGGYFLFLLDRRPRKLPPAAVAAILDAAAVLAPLLRSVDPPVREIVAAPRPPAFTSAPPPHEPVPPRLEAHRRIEAALTACAGGAGATLLMLDLDRFRSINQALGPAVGDAVLAAITTRLNGMLGPADTVARLDGDRFAVVTNESAANLDRTARRMLDAVRQPVGIAGTNVTVNASIGIVTDLRPGVPAHVVLLRADMALRRAKADGRNRFALHEPLLDDASLERSRLELDLSQAAANGQLRLAYQPFIDLATGAAAGVEALIRWRHPVRGEIPPASFIPLAEANGLILPLGTWALRTACAQGARWPGDLRLAVNISALQFHQPSFSAQVDAALAASGFPPERLELEITETVLMRDNPETIGQIEALIDRGIHIALDDFGTGYSALAYLSRLPHHRIKLDKSFIQDLGTPSTAELVRAIIALARSNGVGITAEGIERPDQLALVKAMGFTHAQGFALGQPMSNPGAFLAPPLGVAPVA